MSSKGSKGKDFFEVALSPSPSRYHGHRVPHRRPTRHRRQFHRPPAPNWRATALATDALHEALLFTGQPPPLPSPPLPTKLVPKDPLTPPKATLRHTMTPKTLALISETQGCHAAAFINGVYGERARYRFALVHPHHNPLQTWTSGLRISRSHFVTCSEERAALVLDTLWPVPSMAPVRRQHPRLEPPVPLPAPGPDQHTLTQFQRYRQHTPSPPAASATTSSAPVASLPDHYNTPTTAGGLQRGHLNADAPQV